jgi:hypothetical protein
MAAQVDVLASRISTSSKERSSAAHLHRPRLWCALAVAVFAAILAATPCRADQPLTFSEQQEFNYAFATQVGSGIYTIDGRTLQVYRLPLSYAFKDSEEGRAVWRLTFPMTFGFYSFDPEDVLNSNLGENVATFSLVPGAEFLVPVSGHWLLKPFAEAGYVWDRGGNADAAIYSAGLRSRLDFEGGGFDMVLGNGLNYALVDPSGSTSRDAMVALETAFTASHLFGQGGQAQADYEPYFVGRVYFGGEDHPLQGHGSNTLVQYEAGMTLGSRGPMKLWKIPLPRVGVGYVFGHDLAALRIVFGTPAASLRR